MGEHRSPDQLIEDLGGCGRYQIRLNVVLHTIKIGVAWSLFTMAILPKTPSWWCVDDTSSSNSTSHSNIPTSQQNASNLLYMSCLNKDGAKCERFVFDDSLKTIVSEFGLVCDKAFIPSTIMSIQLAGMLVGNPLAGHLADLIGRKTPIFISFVLLTVFNLVGIFSTSWIMFAVCRFFIGVGCTFFLTVHYNLVSEFILASWRPLSTGFPSWTIHGCLFALAAWLLRDWQYLLLSCCLASSVCLLSWKLVPESFRWYLSHNRFADAEDVLQEVADVNKQHKPDFTDLSLIDNNRKGDNKRYTLINLFMSKYLTKITILSASNWLALGFVDYGLLFGIQALSGNIFLNFFLFQVTSTPGKLLAPYLAHRIGRKKTTMLCFAMTGIGGFVVGLVQYIDTDYKVELTNGFALVANIGIKAAWGSVFLMTIELYPTVIRNIAFGSLSVIARVGAIIGPQMIFLDTVIPGVMYFMCGGISVVCIIAVIFLPETKGGNLADRIEETGRVLNRC